MGRRTRSFGNVYDVVDAIYRLSITDEALGEVFNIGATEEISILELAKRVKERVGSDSEIQGHFLR